MQLLLRYGLRIASANKVGKAQTGSDRPSSRMRYIRPCDMSLQVLCQSCRASCVRQSSSFQDRPSSSPASAQNGLPGSHTSSHRAVTSSVFSYTLSYNLWLLEGAKEAERRYDQT